MVYEERWKENHDAEPGSCMLCCYQRSQEERLRDDQSQSIVLQETTQVIRL
jgi:hypothetical protein